MTIYNMNIIENINIIHNVFTIQTGTIHDSYWYQFFMNFKFISMKIR